MLDWFCLPNEEETGSCGYAEPSKPVSNFFISTLTKLLQMTVLLIISSEAASK